MRKSVFCSLALLLGYGWSLSATAASTAPVTHFDWREQLGGLTPIKNEGACSGSWAFAAITSGLLAIHLKPRGLEALGCTGRSLSASEITRLPRPQQKLRFDCWKRAFLSGRDACC